MARMTRLAAAGAALLLMASAALAWHAKGIGVGDQQHDLAGFQASGGSAAGILPSWG